jgi:hypothetical protein
MNDQKKKSRNDWLPIIFFLAVLPIAFTFGGAWAGIPVLIIGIVALGWSKRHEGPFSTNKPSEKQRRQ